jgi:hypothetical protein
MTCETESVQSNKGCWAQRAVSLVLISIIIIACSIWANKITESRLAEDKDEPSATAYVPQGEDQWGSWSDGAVPSKDPNKDSSVSGYNPTEYFIRGKVESVHRNWGGVFITGLRVQRVNSDGSLGEDISEGYADKAFVHLNVDGTASDEHIQAFVVHNGSWTYDTTANTKYTCRVFTANWTVDGKRVYYPKQLKVLKDLLKQ